MEILGRTAEWLLQGVLSDELAVDQIGETEHETIRRLANVLLFTGDTAGDDSAEVFPTEITAEAEFGRRLRNMKAMESEARAEWAEIHSEAK